MNKIFACTYIMSFLFFSCSSYVEKEYYDNGNLKKECEVCEGKHEIFCIEYDTSGNVKEKKFVFIDKNEFVSYQFLEKMDAVENYRLNELHGAVIYMNKMGMITERFYYENGVQKLYCNLFMAPEYKSKTNVYKVIDMKAYMLGARYYDSLDFDPKNSNFYHSEFSDPIVIKQDTVTVEFEFYEGLENIEIELYGDDDSVSIKLNEDETKYVFKSVSKEIGIRSIKGKITGLHTQDEDNIHEREMPVIMYYYTVSSKEAEDKLRGIFLDNNYPADLDTPTSR